MTRLAYGKGCLGAEIGKVHRPALGSTSFAIDLSGAAANQPALLMLGRNPASLDLSAAGAPGCSFLTSSEVAVATATSPTGTSSIGVPIPINVSLPAAFFAQWVAADPGTPNPLPLSFSDGLEVLLER